MELDKETLQDGLEYVVGTWRPEYVVNGFSNDLAHIPASEFKGENAPSFAEMTFEFFEDHRVVLTDPASGKVENGTWEQTDRYKYRYTFDAFFEIPEGDFKEAAQTLEVIDCKLVFSIGFLAVALIKIADGVVTKAPDIGDIEMTEEDLKADAIVGRYQVFKALTMIGDSFEMHTREEVEKDLQARGASPGEQAEELAIFDMVYEFCADHTFVCWAKIPAGVSQKEIDEALKAGEIGNVKDGFYSSGTSDWKSLGGKYYYNTHEERSLFDKPVSPWDELTFDEEGLLPFSSGFVKLKKIG